MIFHEYGEKGAKTVMLLHGGGMSSWMWKAQAETLKENYRVIVAVIDGHGEAAETTYESIEKCARETISYINENAGGKLFALCGLSLGAQIAVEMLSEDGGITQKAVIESALVIPQKWLGKSVSAMTKMSYSLIKNRRFAKLQAAQLTIPDDMFEEYFADSVKMSKGSLINMLKTNISYKLPEAFKKTQADILVLYGEKERRCMKESAKLVASAAHHTELKELSGFAHGEMTLNRPQEYLDIVLNFFENR